MEQQVSVVVDSVRSFLVQLGQFFPKLIGAVIILVAGWFLAKFLAFLVIRGLKVVNFNIVTEKSGIDGFLKKGGIKKNTIDILGLLVYWLVILGTLLIAFNALGLAVVSELFREITRFIPHVIVAVLILSIGLYFARFMADTVIAYGKNVGLQDAEMIGRLTRWAIVVFVFLLALGQLNIADRYLQPAFLIILSGIVLGLALAFGLGGQKWAADQIDKLTKKK